MGAAYLTGSGVATLQCSVSDALSGNIVARVAVPVVVMSTRWPVWDDALVLSDDGILSSVREGWVANLTAALLETFKESGVATAGALLSSALMVPTGVLAAVSDAAQKQQLTDTKGFMGGLSELSLTLNGPTRLILRSVVNRSRSFVPGMTSMLGSSECTIQGVSASGDMLLLTTPPTASVCPSASAAGVECGHVSLVLNTTGAPAADGEDRTIGGAALACPPFCPGAVGDASTVLADGGYGPVPRDAGSFALGWIPPRSARGAAALPVVTATSSASSPLGIYYALQCFQTGAYTDPTSGACSSAAHPASYSCAFGSGDGCRMCPSNALCPGGSRMWPRAGAWTASETFGSVSPCSPPDALLRCLGWNVTVGATQCGPGYLQGSYLCGSCASSYYGDSDGSCSPCPLLTSPWQRYSGVVYVAVSIVALVAAVWAGLALMVRLKGGTMAGGAAHMLAFAVWALQAAQVVSNAGAVTAASLPSLIRRLYSAVAALQLEGVLLPPACTGAYPFEQEAALMALALGCWWGAVASYYRFSRSAPGAPSSAIWRAARQAGRVALIGALVLFAPVSRTATELLVCETVTMSPAGVVGLNGGSSLAASSPGGASLQISTLATNPFFVCWVRDGAHLPVGILAAVTLAAYVFVLPVLTLWWALSDRRARGDPGHLPRVGKGSGSCDAMLLLVCKRNSAVPSTAHTGKTNADRSDIMTTHNPLRQGRGNALPSSDIVATSRGARAASVDPPLDPLIAPLVSDFTPAAFYTKWVDLGLLLLLSLLRALMPRPSIASSIVLKGAIACAGILAVALHVVTVRPFPRRDSWKGWVRFLLLIDAAGCVAMNAAVTLQDYGLGSAVMGTAVRVGAYALFAACMLTLVVLLVGATVAAYLGLVKEEGVKAATAARVTAAHASESLRLGPVIGNPTFSGDADVELVGGPAVRHLAGEIDHDSLQQFRDTSALQSVRMGTTLLCTAQPRRRAPVSLSSATRQVAKHVNMLEQLQRANAGDNSAASTSVMLKAISGVGTALRSGRVDPEAAALSVRPLVAALQGGSGNRDMLIAACDALTAAAEMDSSGGGDIGTSVSTALIEAGAASALVAMLSGSAAAADVEDVAYSEHASAQAAAGAALARLAHTSLGAASVVASGGLGPLTALLSRADGSPGIVAAACAPLAALAMHHDDPAHLAALVAADVMEAVAGALVRLAAAGQLGAAAAAAAAAASPAAFPWNPTARTAVEAATAVVTNATVDEGALARFIAAGGLAPLLALLAVSLARGDAELVCSLAAALCSVAVSTQGAAALSAAGAEGTLLEALDASPLDAPSASATLEPLCWSLQGVVRVLQQQYADPPARARLAALAERGVPLLRRVLASSAVVEGGDAVYEVAARVRALLESLEGVRG